jgi:hypothetical protein
MSSAKRHRPGFVLIIASLAAPLHASSGTESAGFLNIPVGARPAAMGSAYTALAADAYAPTWNPAGLGFLDSIQFAGQHLAYVQSTHYEYLGFGVPMANPRACATDLLCGRSTLGGSIQYFGSGDISGLDIHGNPTGDYSNHYAAYNLSYGRTFGDRLSFGVTGKLINAKLADVSANAYAVDLGTFYKLKDNLHLAATLMNIGSRLTFLSDGDPLPLAFHMGGAYRVFPLWKLALEAVFPRTGLASVHMGAEWNPLPSTALRLGYRTDALKGLSPIAGFSAGVGIHIWDQELAYAWVPYGDLGDSHYVSLIMQFGEAGTQKRNLIKYEPVKRRARVAAKEVEPVLEQEQLMELLNESEKPPKVPREPSKP